MMLAKATPPSSFSTACRRAAPTARMVACGGLMMAENSVLGPDRVGGRDALQRRRPGLDDEVVDRELERGPHPSLPRLRGRVREGGRRGIGFLTQRQQARDLDVGGEIEMRDGGLRLH